MNLRPHNYRLASSSSDRFRVPKKRRFVKGSISLLVVFLVLGLGVHLALSAKASAREATVANAAKLQHEVTLQNALPAKINTVISQNPDITLSVSLINLDSGSSQNFGDLQPVEAASTAKLITAALFLHEVEQGRASLNDQYGGYSAAYQLRQLIQQSDDTAWQLFNDQLGNDNLQAYASSLGLVSYDVNANSINSSDMAKLLAKLYKGQLLNSAHTKLLLSYMQNTNYEDFITPAIPSGEQIFHKVGLLDDNVNDAAVIDSGSQSFVLVIFTDGNGNYDWTARAALMQQITKLALPAYLG